MSILLMLGIFFFPLMGCDASGDVLPTTDITMTTDVKTAIQDYLQSADSQGNGVAIKKGDTITVDYIGRLNDEEVFDTSIEEIAKKAGIYMTGRNYVDGLTFEVGAGKMIAGFDQGVVGMKVGQTKTISIPAEQAYGQRREDLVKSFPLSEVPNADQLQEGMRVYLQYGMTALVTKKTESDITIDMNHELAGKDLIFDITIKSLK